MRRHIRSPIMGNGRALEPHKLGLGERSIAHNESAGTAALRAAHVFEAKNPNKTHECAARIFFSIKRKERRQIVSNRRQRDQRDIASFSLSTSTCRSLSIDQV